MRSVLLLVLASACVPPTTDTVDPPDADAGLAVIATSSDDYTVGALTVVGVADRVIADVAAIHTDAVLSVEPDPFDPGRSIVWEINRLNGDSVRRYAPGVWDAPVWEAAMGPGANPHDANTCQGRLFVSLYERAELAILSPDTGASLGTVDLSSVADADGLPEVSGLFVLDDALYAVAQRLDRDHGWSVEPGGQLVRIDCASGAVVRTWPLGPNPQLGGEGAAVFASQDGVRTFDGDAVSGVQLENVDGAPLIDLAVGDGGIGAFVARDDDGRHLIGCVDTSADPWGVTPLGWMEHFVPDVAVHGPQAWFAVRRGWNDPTEAGGVRVVDLTTCSEVGDDWLRPRFAPYSLGFVPCVGAACGAAEGSSAARTQVGLGTLRSGG